MIALLPAAMQSGAMRLAIVLGLLTVLLACQARWPRRGDPEAPARRWRNVALAAISSALVLAVPLTTILVAARAQAHGLGVLSTTQWPAIVEFVLAIVALDLAIYWQHRWFHRFPFLWRIHGVHHSDVRFEATLGLRFHPAEILLSLGYKFAVVLALGASPLAVASYEVLLAAFSLVTHADIAVPRRHEAWLRRVVVTPDWHRVHHSVHRHETDANYGNFLTIWDRLFASRVEQPADGHRDMAIGLDTFREPADQTLPALLRQPFATVAPTDPNRGTRPDA